MTVPRQLWTFYRPCHVLREDDRRDFKPRFRTVGTWSGAKIPVTSITTALMTFCQPKGIVTPPLGSLRSDIVSAEQHRAIRIEQSSVHFLGRS
jgi:hypothetical protein